MTSRITPPNVRWAIVGLTLLLMALTPHITLGQSTAERPAGPPPHFQASGAKAELSFDWDTTVYEGKTPTEAGVEYIKFVGCIPGEYDADEVDQTDWIVESHLTWSGGTLSGSCRNEREIGTTDVVETGKLSGTADPKAYQAAFTLETDTLSTPRHVEGQEDGPYRVERNHIVYEGTKNPEWAGFRGKARFTYAYTCRNKEGQSCGTGWPDVQLTGTVTWDMVVWDQPSQTETNFQIDHVEVVQVVQDQNNTIPLVAGKSTVARVFVRLDGQSSQSADQVTGSLRGSRGSEVLQPVNSNGLITPSASPARDSVDAALNFRLPLGWTVDGTLILTAEVKPPAASPGTTKIFTANPVTFTKRNTLTVGYLLLCVQPLTATNKACAEDEKPNADRVAQHNDLMAKLYPVADDGLIYTPLPIPAVAYRKPLVTQADATALLARLRKIYIFLSVVYSPKEGPTALDQLTAWVPYNQYTYARGAKIILGLGDIMGYTPGSTGHTSWEMDVNTLGDLYPQFALAHEVGHALGLRHPGTGEDSCGAEQPNADWSSVAGYKDATIQEVGFDLQATDPAKQVIPRTRKDLMTYCKAEDTWISPYHYKRLFDGNLRPQPPPSPPSTGQRAPAFGGRLASALAAPPFENAEYLIVGGAARRDGSAGRLDPAYRITAAEPVDPSDPAGNHCLRFSGANGTLADYCFTLKFEGHVDQAPLDGEEFALRVPYPAGTTRLALLRGDKELAALSLSGSAPAVSITSPRAGEMWEGTHTLSWSATRAGGQELAYAVLYTPDGGKTWYPMGVDMTESQLTFDTARIASGDWVSFRVLASNGLNTGQAESPPIRVPKQTRAKTTLPTVTITPLSLGACGSALCLGLAGLVAAGVVVARSRPRAARAPAAGGPGPRPPAMHPPPPPQAPALARERGPQPARPRVYPVPAPHPAPPRPAGLPAHLVVTGGVKAQSVDLPLGGLIIGRDHSCGLVIDDPLASRQHARLDFTDGNWVVTDMNSRNGTLVNGVRVTRWALSAGDHVQIGDTVLVFQTG